MKATVTKEKAKIRPKLTKVIRVCPKKLAEIQAALSGLKDMNEPTVME